MGNTAALGVRPQADLMRPEQLRMLREPTETPAGGGLISNLTGTPGIGVVPGVQGIGTAPRKGAGIVGGMAGGNMPAPMTPYTPTTPTVAAPVAGTPASTMGGTPVKKAKGTAETDPYERWKQLGRPGGNFDAWKASQ